MLDEQVAAIKEISETLKSSASERKLLMDQKVEQGKIRQYKELRDLGILTDEEFKQKVRNVMGL